MFELYTFRELASKMTATKVKQELKRLGIMGYSRLRKEALLELFQSTILEEGHLRASFLEATNQEIRNLEQAIRLDLRVPPETWFYGYWIAQYLCFVGEDLILHIPREVERYYEELKKDRRFWKLKSRVLQIEQYAKACTNLYGVLTLEKFLEIMNEQSGIIVTGEEVRDCFEEREKIRGVEAFFYQDGYLVNDLLAEGMMELEDGYRTLLEKQEGKPYYIPEKRELLCYAKPLYTEENEAFSQMLAYLHGSLQILEAEAYDLCADIQLSLRLGQSTKQVLANCMQRGLVFSSEEEKDAFGCRLHMMHYHTRMPEHRGHTIAELHALERAGTRGMKKIKS